MTDQTKTIGINGRRYRSLNQDSTVAAYSMKPVRGLEQPTATPHLNSTMPKAPVGYAWPHMAAPARAIKGQ